MQIIYPDVLFLINFSMDFIALYLGGVFVNAPKDKRLLALSSLVGGVFSVLVIILNTRGVLGIALNIVLPILLCYIAYGKEVRGERFFRLIASFFVVSIALGGAITAFYNFLYDYFRYSEYEGTGEGNRMLVFMAVSTLCASLIYSFSRIFTSSSKETKCKISIHSNGKEKEFSAFVDSGNLLKDPFTGAPVIIMNFSAIKDLIPYDTYHAVRSWCEEGTVRDGLTFAPLRFIPSKSLGGEKILIAYKPEKIEIIESKKSGSIRYVVDAIIAFNNENDKFDGLDAIVPVSLVA